MQHLQFYQKEGDIYTAIDPDADKNSLGCAIILLLFGGLITALILTGNSDKIGNNGNRGMLIFTGLLALPFGIIKIRGYKRRLKLNLDKKAIQITYAGFLKKEEVRREYAFSRVIEVFKKEKFRKGVYRGTNIEIKLEKKEGGTKNKKIWRNIEDPKIADAILQESKSIMGMNNQ